MIKGEKETENNKENNIKRILITAAGVTDPYTITNGEYHDASIMAILRKKLRDKKPITDIYIYLSLEMAVREFRKDENNKDQNIITKAINSLYGKNINIKFFPNDIENDVKNALNNISEETIKTEIEKAIENKAKNSENIDKEKIKKGIDKNKIIANLIKDDVKIAISNVNKFGLFYPIYYEMFEQGIKEDKNAEIYVNISSGTSAMQEDIALIALTNKEKKSIIMQVSTPQKSSNTRGEYSFITSSEEELKTLNEQEQARKDTGRVTIEEMLKTRKVMLLHSLEDSFSKNDFAGVYDAIKENEEIINNKNIIKYAKNLYYRYIGNDKVAREWKEDEDTNITENEVDVTNSKKEIRIELYPIFDDDKEEALQLRNLIERINIMNVKAERNEINDWLLLAETVVESLYIKLIYKTCNNLDINALKNNDDKISYTEFVQVNRNQNYNWLEDCMKKFCKVKENRQKGTYSCEDKFIQPYFLNDVLKAWWNRPDRSSGNPNKRLLRQNITFLNKITKFRNLAAHTSSFITKDELQNEFTNNENSQNEDVIKTTNEKIKQILQIIRNGNCQVGDLELDNSLNVYSTIQKEILRLLKEEIKEEETKKD